MFTGLVRELGSVISLRRGAADARLAVSAPLLSGGAALGASISVNGACLTVAAAKGDALEFDISAETLRSTDLGGLKPGEKVNLEPALLAQDALGGHLVSGHVDAVGRIRAKVKAGDAWKVEIDAPPPVLRYLVQKGSVTVDGISLTVVDLLADGFTVMIIPHTAHNTTIGFKEPGTPVNLEADIIGKYVAKFLGKMGVAGEAEAGKHGLTMKSLRDSGYVNE